MQFAITTILILITVAVAALMGHSSRVHYYNSTVRRLAEAFQGSFRRMRLLGGGGPLASFDYSGASASLQLVFIHGKTSQRCAELRIVWPDLTLNYEVFPRRWSRRIVALFHRDVLKVGSPQFDRDFIVRGTSPRDPIRRQLDANVQASIYRLYAVRGLDDLLIHWRRGTLIIRGTGQIYEFRALLEFTSLGLRLFDSLVSTSTGGVCFVDRVQLNSSSPLPGDKSTRGAVSELAAPTSGADFGESHVCPLCRDPLHGLVVQCRQCDTPHHHECWRFHGGCSIYGCGERRYARGSRRRARR